MLKRLGKKLSLMIALCLLVSLMAFVPIAQATPASDTVIALIEDIYTEIDDDVLNINWDNRYLITKARTAYTALPTSDRGSVSNYADLVTAEANYIWNLVKDISLEELSLDDWFNISVATDQRFQTTRRNDAAVRTAFDGIQVDQLGYKDGDIAFLEDTYGLNLSAGITATRWLEFLMARLWSVWVEDTYQRCVVLGYDENDPGDVTLASLLHLWQMEGTYYDGAEGLFLGRRRSATSNSMVGFDGDSQLEAVCAQALETLEELQNLHAFLIEQNQDDFATAKEVEKRISDIQCLWIFDRDAVAEVREDFNELSEYQRSQVNNYALLMQYENDIWQWEEDLDLEHPDWLIDADAPHPDAPANLTFSGSRVCSMSALGSDSSTYTIDEDPASDNYGNFSSIPANTNPWPAPAGFEAIAQQLTKSGAAYFPDADSVFVWIVGVLNNSGSGTNAQTSPNCPLEFELPTGPDASGVDRDENYWKAKYIINSSNVRRHPDHQKYLSYFDQVGIKVYLQFESGCAKPTDLIECTYEALDLVNHPSVVGFGYDIEWYLGNDNDDSGIPVTAKHGKEWVDCARALMPCANAGIDHYKVFVKSYMPAALPVDLATDPDYMDDIIFVNDSQSIGSIDGSRPGEYDDHIRNDTPGMIPGFMPEYKLWADYFYPATVCYQMGYMEDSQWYAQLDEPVIKTLANRLGEFTNQDYGFIWVDFATKTLQAFPVLYDLPYATTTTQYSSSLNTMMGYLNTDPAVDAAGQIGGRFGAYMGIARPITRGFMDATLHDAMFIATCRHLYDGIDPIRRSVNNYANRFTPALEAAALKIRIENLPEVIQFKDKALMDAIIADIEAYKDARGNEPTVDMTPLDAAFKAWDDLRCQITWNLGDSNYEDIDDFPNECQYGETLNVKAPELEGFIFDGWYADLNDETCIKMNTLTEFGETITIWGDITLYANWIAVTQTITFVVDEVHTEVEVIQGEKVNMPDTPKKVGYTFAGWFTNPKADPDKDKSFDFNTPIVEDIILYAVWKIPSSVSKSTGDTDKLYKEESDDKTPLADYFPFTDVGENHWFYDDVYYAWENGLVKGTSATLFSPDMILTRATAVTILWRAEGEPNVDDLNNPFDDIDNNWYTDAVIWAADKGIVRGYPDGTFMPDRPISRQELAAILYRYVIEYLENDLPVLRAYSGFPDEDNILEYAFNAVTALYSAEIINGRTNGNFDPLSTATRAEFVAMFHRLQVALDVGYNTAVDV